MKAKKMKVGEYFKSGDIILANDGTFALLFKNFSLCINARDKFFRNKYFHEGRKFTSAILTSGGGQPTFRKVPR